MAKDESTAADDSAEGTEHLSAEEKSAAEEKALKEKEEAEAKKKEEEEEEGLSEEEKEEKKKKEEQEEQDRRSRQGQVKKQFQMLATEDDYTLEDVPERLREEVIAYQKEIAEKIKQPDETDKGEDKVEIKKEIKEELKEETLLETELDKLGEKEATLAEETYEDLKEHGYSPREARIKTIALHSIPSDTEYTAHAGRSHKVGGNARTKVKTREDDAAEEAEAALPPEFKA